MSDRALVEEVRVAMALNGGVSLAVWMGGCAVELDCARRAHLHPEDVEKENDQQPPPRTVYNALCSAFRRELVLDLMSGSSAGGINGALLATAIVHNRRLHPQFVRKRWIELGDFGRLLRDTTKPDPPSLMDGEYFKKGLTGAFKAIVDKTDPLLALPPADEQALAGRTVALEVTTTDVRGRQRTFRDHWGEDLVAHEYRGRFQFREPIDFSVDRLATAARSSASFPIAFEPSEVPGGMLRDIAEPRWAIDGGVLDNAPIKAVLDLIPTRPADRQVQRYVCYVNADPPIVGNAAADMPTLEQTLGYALNLPRQATFVDHLDAVERATSSGDLADEGQTALLQLPLPTLIETANELLPAYRARRRLVSLRDLLDDPRLVEAVYARLDQTNELPWIPATLDPPPPGEWGWGARAAQRAIHLLIDLVREAAKKAGPKDRGDLFDLRAQLDEQLGAIEAAFQRIAGSAVTATVKDLAADADVTAELEALKALMRDPGRDPAIRDAVEAAANAVLAKAELVARHTGEEPLTGLFGSGPDRFAHFLQRTLAIEVVRRAFSADDAFQTAQRLRFAQLTPCAPALLFAPREDGDVWDMPREKLTGVELGHFAAFYRASWRANDFMWGRLDAAVRIMDLLVDPERARQVVKDGGEHPARVLADRLLPAGVSAAQRRLIAEELGGDGDLADLRDRLAAALEEDLAAQGARTRAICARAAQLEILEHELPILVALSEQDVALGTSAPALAIDTSEPWTDTIAAIRSGPTFPERLGLNLKEEPASALAMRTSTHAAFVGLAALRATRRPLTRALSTLRGPLLPVAGLVSQSLLNKLAVVVAFWATAVLVGSRLATTHEAAPPVSALWSLPVVATYLAVVGVAAIAAVPGWRIARAGKSARRRAQIAWLTLLVATGGAIGLACALIAGVGGDALLVQSQAKAPPDAVLAIAVAVTLGLPVALPFAPVRKAVTEILARPWGGRSALVVTLVPWALVGGFAARHAIDTLFDFDGWRSVTAGIGLIGAPLALLGYVYASRIRMPHKPQPRLNVLSPAALVRRLRSRPRSA